MIETMHCIFITELQTFFRNLLKKNVLFFEPKIVHRQTYKSKLICKVLLCFFQQLLCDIGHSEEKLGFNYEDIIIW